MLKILNILVFDLKKLTKDKKTLIFMLVIPFVMIVIFTNVNYSNTSKIPCGIVNYDGKEISTQLINELNNDDLASFTVLSEEDVIKKVKDSSIEMGFIIPSGFTDDIVKGKIPEVTSIKLTESPNSKALEYSLKKALTNIRSNEIIISTFKSSINKAKIKVQSKTIKELSNKVAANLKKPNIITVDHSIYSDNIKNKTNGNKLTTTIGLLVIFLMMTMMFSSGGVILEEKKENTWSRMIISPTNSSLIYIGNILSTFVKGWIQIALTIMFSWIILGVNWGNSISALMLLMTAFIISAASMGIFLSTVISTNAQLTSIASITVLCTSMVSGCFWPIELQPLFMQKIAVIFPQYWVMKGMRSVIDSGLGYDAIMKPTLIMLFISFLFFAATIIRQRFSSNLKFA